MTKLKKRIHLSIAGGIRFFHLRLSEDGIESKTA